MSAPPPFPSKPVPPGAWDTHHHIFEPTKFPLAAGRHFTPAPATLEQLIAFERSLGVERVVVAHGLSYGADCTSLLHYLSVLNSQECGSSITAARGICVLDLDAVTDAQLSAYHAAGVRSVRLDFFRHQAMHDAAAQVQLIRRTDERLRQWADRTAAATTEPGQAAHRNKAWSIQIQQPHLEFWPQLRAVAKTLRGPLVVDHLASMELPSLRRVGAAPTTTTTTTTAWTPAEEAGFQELLGALRDGNTWVKVSAPYRCSDDAPRFGELRQIVRALVDANADRVVWGSDWPHTQRHKNRVGRSPHEVEPFLAVDDAAWVRELGTWLGEAEWRKMWVENPGVLYDWQ